MALAEENGIVISSFRTEAKDYCRNFKMVVKDKIGFLTDLSSFEEIDNKEKFLS
jgi:hypothetical protein